MTDGPDEEPTAETPEERRARWRSVGALMNPLPATRKVHLDDGVVAEREYVPNEEIGGQAGYHDKMPDGTVTTTITPTIPTLKSVPHGPEIS